MSNRAAAFVRTAAFQAAWKPCQSHRMQHKGWRTRGYLPHYDGAEVVQHVVFGLADAFPHERNAPESADDRWRWREDALDRCAGECLLRGEAATAVEEALLHFDNERYGLFAWCVMPNHVHVIVGVMQGWPLGSVVHSWKSFSANRVNAIHKRTGHLRRREYYDRFMRDNDELETTRHYVEQNPVKAKFAEEAEDWRWSSAWVGRSLSGGA